MMYIYIYLRGWMWTDMEERVSLAQVKNWGWRNFIEHGYDFIIRMESFGDMRCPVIHISLTRCGHPKFDFPIVLDNYEPKYPDSNDWDFGDKVIVDFYMFDKIFHEELKKFWKK